MYVKALYVVKRKEVKAVTKMAHEETNSSTDEQGRKDKVIDKLIKKIKNLKNLETSISKFIKALDIEIEMRECPTSGKSEEEDHAKAIKAQKSENKKAKASKKMDEMKKIEDGDEDENDGDEDEFLRPGSVQKILEMNYFDHGKGKLL